MTDIDFFSFPPGAIAALFQVIMIDLVLAGDNAVIIGLAAAGLPPAQRSRAILVGIIAATVLRIVFAAVAVELLDIVGLLLAGGILLLEDVARAARPGSEGNRGCITGGGLQRPAEDLRASRLADRYCGHLHVARQRAGGGGGGARPSLCADLRAWTLNRSDGRNRHRWIAYVGLAIILYVSANMIWRGAVEVWPHVFG